MWCRNSSLVALAAVAASCANEPRWRLQADRTALAADGRDTLVVRLLRQYPWDPRTWSSTPVVTLAHSPALDVRLTEVERGRWTLTAGRKTGRTSVHAAGQRIDIEIEPAIEDRDRDGLPDAIELWSENDRAAFTAWFTAIAEAQAYRLDDQWAPIHRDCAGLVRFAFKEALKPHDAGWWAQRKWNPGGAATDVEGLRYPSLPIVSDRPFRQLGGAFDPARPVDEQFSAAPSARTLWQHNTDFIGRGLDAARAGDLLFYRVVRGTATRMHTMIVLGAEPGADHRRSGRRVVYHTGSTDSGPGEVRLVSFEALSAHPEIRWRPVAHNPHFLGVHRLRHLTASVEAIWASTRSL